MHKDIEYIRHYIGPVFFVNKKSIKHATVSRNVESCPNSDCLKHQEPVRGLPLHCTECGSKIQNVLCHKYFEETPSAHAERFYDRCCSVSNGGVNGTDYFMEPLARIFSDDSQQVYLPKIGKDDFKFGIVDNKTVGHYCIYDECKWKNHYTHSDYKYCQDCGRKLNINVTHAVKGILPEHEAISVFETYMHSNYDSFQFIDNHEWEDMVQAYSQTDDCKEITGIIEKAYGEGSVTMRLAFVSYHSVY